MDKEVEKVVDDLGLSDLGNYDGKTFIVELDSSDKFSTLYTEISNKYEQEDDTEMQSFNDTTSVTVFSTDSVEIIASANYDNDLYTISIGRK